MVGEDVPRNVRRPHRRRRFLREVSPLHWQVAANTADTATANSAHTAKTNHTDHDRHRYMQHNGLVHG